ncbi:MAG TPA: methylated-DNA--[protein]-cysteine S-methyltransferase [Candidatus Baltobacteraceae bacterium]|jgi:methylated-DNA-[protein]-cysteine S-methyltransferase|nr:methylated-DNA--[protein]-cysteine S-methyltransferase [Candidatus Baltobacteraceae bacterium]
MRCREVEALWDEIRDGMPSLRQAVDAHLRSCPPCQELFEQYEGVAYCLSCLPKPEPSCDLAKKIVQHIASVKQRLRTEPVTLTSLPTPVGKVYVGYKGTRIAFIGLDRGEPAEHVRERIEQRLRRPVVSGEPPPWLQQLFDQFFKTWSVDENAVDISDLTPFEQAALKAAAQIPPGQVRSYAWVAQAIGRPKAARAVGQVMARNPLPLFFPCHRVVDSSGELHNYGYGIEMKARLLSMEGYGPARRR